MITRDERLRRVSESVFQEAEAPEDRSRPLEWRCRLNHLDLPLRNLEIVTSCVVHDSDFDWDENEIRGPLDTLQTKISDGLEIRGVLDESRARDRVHVAEELEDEKDIFIPQRVLGKTKVTLRVGTPVEEGKKLPTGLYRGHAFRMSYEPGEDDLHFELSAPEAQLRGLVDHLRRDPTSTLELSVYLLSFSYEVDDALREHYHPRDLFIVGTPPCLLFWAGAFSRIGEHQVEKEEDDVDDWVSRPDESSPVDAPNRRSNASDTYTLKSVATLQRSLRGIQFALWALVVVFALNAVV